MFSIVVPTYNRRDLVKKCVPHNINNSGVDRGSIELIWVDDGSTDGVDEVIKELNPEISILKKNNEGVFKAYNSGYVLSSGDWIIKMGSDLLLPNNWLLTLRGYLEAIPETAGIGIPIKGFYDYCEGGWLGEEKEFYGKRIYLASHLMGFYAFSRELFESVGYFDEDYGWYGPGDWDWAERANRTGELLYYISELKAEHLGDRDEPVIHKKKVDGAVAGERIMKRKNIDDPLRVYYTPYA